MFLKRVEMQGFKSFADKVVISFDHSVTGIVGPNGCGKSNITDAVRWVLGEQSVKSLRGTSMTDVIFAGSADRKMVGMAEVTLVFDNGKHLLNSELDEIEITRRIYRANKEAEYLINKKPSRLKDIIDLVLDSGLGKDSLSMISQGNISSFAEAKPIDRRAIFEEAAGVAKYKKRKIESLNKLQRVKDNLDRCNDIVAELEKQVTPLKRQARKAEIYREKKQRLQEIETAVLVAEIKQLSESIEETNKTLFDIDTQTAMFETSITINENQNEEARKQSMALERDVNILQDELMHLLNEIQIIEQRKIEMDEKSKYILEVGNIEQKAKELQSLLNDARIEFEDRQSRYETLHSEVSLLQQQLAQTALDLSDENQKNSQANITLQRLQNRKAVLENMIKEPFSYQHGVKAVMDNQHFLPGVLGVITQVMKPEDGYEEAINVALGGAAYQIVTKDEASARQAINFLKKNENGRATFFPLNVARPHYLPKEQLIIARGTEGFLGLASDFTSCDERFEPIKDNLLGNVIVCDTLENANNLATLLKHNAKIVTLDGSVIHRGGSMTGGKTKGQSSLMSAQKDLKVVNSQMDSAAAQCQLAQQKIAELQGNRKRIESDLMEKRIALAQLEPIIDAKRSKYEKYKNDLAALGADGIKEEDLTDNDLVIRLNNAYNRRDELTNSIRNKREERMRLVQDSERKEQQIRQIRKDLNLAMASKNAIEIDKARIETKLDSQLQRLGSEYQMTYEYALTQVGDVDVESAREEVAQLRYDIEHLGNINMNAPEEYNEVNTRFEFMTKQMKDLEESRDKILKAIDEMDGVMTKQFKEMFYKINTELSDIFRQLFGGGKASLILEDPTDLLNTGIDIDVQPPGKAVQNIRLFSGGEKSLIALCVLFAILKVKPVPLVIFDEVEAALDQGNVERFARFIKNYEDQTQFIVVTHRPGTMQECDILYGVTMQKAGVSQMLKVELTEAMEMAEKEEEE